MLQLLQHREMTRIVHDETARLLERGSTTSWQEVCQARGELEELEHNQLWRPLLQGAPTVFSDLFQKLVGSVRGHGRPRHAFDRPLRPL